MKKALALLLAILLLGSLMACAGTEKTTTADQPQTTQEPAPSESSDKTEQTEISFITWRAEDSNVIKSMIADFEAKNPDIKVNLEVTSTDETEYYTVLKSRLISGEGADVMNIHPGAHMKEILDAGYLLELDDTGLAETIDPGMLDAGMRDGKLYGLLVTYNSFALYYNKDLFDELGIEPLTGDYESLLNAAQKSREAGYMPVAAGFGDVWPAEILHEALFTSYGKEDIDIMQKLVTGEAKLTDEPYVSIFEDFLTMYNDGIFQDNVTGTGYDASISLFASGKATMLLDGTWSVASVKNMNADMNIGFVAIPAIQTETLAVTVPSQLICINAKSEKQEAAKRFAAYLVSVEGETTYCNGTLQASTVQGTTLDLPELDEVAAMMAAGTELICTYKLENSKLESVIDDLCGRLMAGGDLMTELEVTQAEIDTLREQ